MIEAINEVRMRTLEDQQQALHRRVSERSLSQDIAYLENRIEEMGFNGDCAYERAMVNTYEKLLLEKRAALEEMRSAHQAA
jgi:hypothetical protein